MFDQNEKKVQLVEKKKNNNKSSLYDEFKIGDELGGFTGYLRLSNSGKVDLKDGMVVNIFGENGEMSDTIVALSLTKYLNVPVKVTIWGLKDKDGRLLKDKEGNFPKFTQFIGKVQRPKPSDLGMTARLWGEAGGNADAIIELNKTAFKDSLVKVIIQLAEEGLLLSEIETETPELDSETFRLTPKELQNLKKQQEKFASADQVLVVNSFYTNPEVLKALGNFNDYKEWLLTQKCIIGSCSEPVTAFEFPMNKLIYSAIPICQHHIDEFQAGMLANDYPDINFFFKQMNQLKIMDYTRAKLREKMGIGEDYYLDPNGVYKWCVHNGLTKLIPNAYTMFLSQYQR